LPIPDPLLVELRAAKKRQASEKLVIGAACAELGYVVCNEAGQPYHPDTLSKMWTKAVAAAGVPCIRLHDPGGLTQGNSCLLVVVHQRRIDQVVEVHVRKFFFRGHCRGCRLPVAIGFICQREQQF
jgi:hypothetical protein